MNQIINQPLEKNLNHNSFNRKLSSIKNIFKKNKYRIQFFASTSIAVIFLFVFAIHLKNEEKQEKLSKQLLSNYTLTTLYQSKAVTPEEKESYVIENPFVIGMIRISKINLNYPILSESNKDLLNISLCRFAGPMPNENGNLCIAGHNRVDNKFFSRLAELDDNDTIEIFDLTGKKLTYSVFDKYEVTVDDLSCTKQNVGNKKILTLLTCNNVNGKRTVIKAKATIN